MKNTILKITLAIVIVALGVLLYSSIMKPIRFERELSLRNEQIISRIKDIRNSETFFKQLNNRYTSDFDSLITFLKTGKIPIVKLVPDPKDTTFTRSIADTVGYISVKDSLFGKRTNFNINNLSIIPSSNGKKFNIATDKIDKGGVMVDVIEICVPYETYLSDLDQQDVINLIERQKTINRFPGIKMGSLTEATTDGNWE